MDFEPVQVSLRDGTPLIIRAICPEDAGQLMAMHERLSEHSLLMRYLSLARRPLVDQSARMCDIDHVTRMALVATPDHLPPGQIVAVAGYVVPGPDAPHCADVGIVVEDSFQHKGLGSMLLAELAVCAQAHGICELTADISYDNRAILSFVRQTDLPHQASVCNGLIHVSILITQDLSGLRRDLGRLGHIEQP